MQVQLWSSKVKKLDENIPLTESNTSFIMLISFELAIDEDCFVMIGFKRLFMGHWVIDPMTSCVPDNTSLVGHRCSTSWTYGSRCWHFWSTLAHRWQPLLISCWQHMYILLTNCLKSTNNSGCESSLNKKAWLPWQQNTHGYSQLQHSILFLSLGTTWP